ncbi:MAG: hypothetical protein BGO55_07380 [Sphingobacteriales bacterium 50-39]|nr:hypothetical protein [Sphingobacteriales bacterium]OJW53067.1 MAG: hypothetical protein BGO55_07380 [Sphingobacteriales bacterium 50-39]
MKKIISILVITCFYFASYAQMSNDVLVSARGLGSDRAAIKAAREFWKKYGAGKDESWYKLEAGYFAEFSEGGIKYKSVFDRKGNLLYSMKEYSEKELPKEVRALVKSTYYDYSIGWVKEVSQNQTVVYVVHIADGQNWKDLLVQDGEMEVQYSNEL